MMIYKFTSMHVISWNLIRVADRLAEDRSDEARSRIDEVLAPGLGSSVRD